MIKYKIFVLIKPKMMVNLSIVGHFENIGVFLLTYFFFLIVYLFIMNYRHSMDFKTF
jgi:hypothetical protein